MVIRTNIVICILSVFTFFPCLGNSADSSLERDLQKSLEESVSVIEKAKEKLRGYGSVTPELERLRSLAEEIRASHLLLQETFRSTEEIKTLSGNPANSFGNSAPETQLNVTQAPWTSAFRSRAAATAL